MNFHIINSNYNDFTPTQNRIMVATGIILVLLYLALFVWTCFNIKHYIVDQQRYKTFSVLIFYILAVADELFRIVMYLGVVLVVMQTPGVWFSHPYIYNCCYVVTACVMVMMGFFQAASMLSLALRIGNPHSKKVHSWEKNIYGLVIFINLTAFGWCVYFSYEISKIEIQGAKSCDVPDLYNCPAARESWESFMNFFGWVTATYFCVLTLVLIVSFVILLRSMNKFTHATVSTLKKSITYLFGLLVLSYTLRSAILLGEGHYGFVQVWSRQELQLFLWPILDFTTLIPILLMHYQNFSLKKKVKTEINVSIVEAELDVKIEEDLKRTS